MHLRRAVSQAWEKQTDSERERELERESLLGTIFHDWGSYSRSLVLVGLFGW